MRFYQNLTFILDCEDTTLGDKKFHISEKNLRLMLEEAWSDGRDAGNREITFGVTGWDGNRCKNFVDKIIEENYIDQVTIGNCNRREIQVFKLKESINLPIKSDPNKAANCNVGDLLFSYDGVNVYAKDWDDSQTDSFVLLLNDLSFIHLNSQLFECISGNVDNVIRIKL